MQGRATTLPPASHARNGGRIAAPPRPLAAREVGRIIAVQDAHRTFLVQVGPAVRLTCRCASGEDCPISGDGDCPHIVAALRLIRETTR